MAKVRGLTYGIYSPLDPAFVGGIRTWIDTFWPAYLKATGSRLRVVHLGFCPAGGNVASAPVHPGIETRHVQSFRIPGLAAPLPAASALETALNGIDVLYVDNGYAFQDAYGLRAARRVHAATISGHHSVIRHGVAHRVLWETIGRRFLRRFDAVHALNEADASYLSSIGARNVRVVPIAIDESFFVPAGRGPGLRFAFVGRLHEQKGVDRLARIVPALVDRFGPQLTVEICGDGPQRSIIEGLDDCAGVTYRGSLNRKDVAGVMARADVLIVPSRSETFGIVAAEALMSGAAVLHSDLPALRSVVGECGAAITNPDETAEWVGAAERLVQRLDPATTRAYAISHFSMPSAVERFASLVESARAA